jgi:hypothetical protein
MNNIRRNIYNPIYQFFRILDDEMELNGVMGAKRKSIKVLRKYEKMADYL